MTRVTPERVIAEGQELLDLTSLQQSAEHPKPQAGL
jgi:hypothetical protein